MSGKHARLSPSAASRWMNCPGSLLMEDRCPPQKETSFSAEGTALHELASWALTDGENRCEKYVGVKTANGTEIEEDQADDTQEYVDNLLEYAEGNVLLVEQKLSIEHITGEEGAEGTADGIVITSWGDELQIHDLKMGRGVAVYAEENEQLMTYALAALKQFDVAYDFKRAKLVIHQPRLNNLSEWECSIDHLREFEKKLTKSATLAFHLAEKYRDSDVPAQYLNPDTKTCIWCRAKSSCPALAKKVTDTVGAEFDDLTLINNVKTLVPTQSPEELARKMNAIDMIEDFCKAIRAEVETYLIAGRAVPGFKLVQGRKGHRKWSDPKAIEKLLKSMRYKQDEMYKFKLISPSDAEKLTKDMPGRWDKLKTEIVQNEGKPSVAPTSDTRPALDTNPVEDDFENLT